MTCSTDCLIATLVNDMITVPNPDEIKSGYDFLGESETDAGLAYIGQMISHDIVPPTNKLDHPRRVTSELNLDSLYGELLNNQPDNAPGDVELFDQRGRFKLGRKDCLDLYRINGKAQVPEPRNDENVIISQLHVLWLRLHNFLLDNGYADTALRAREIVCLTFQLIVVEDFLTSLLHEQVFEYFFRKAGKDILPDHSGIPTYFSHASFRFGHSLVRTAYRLKNFREHPLFLSELFCSNKPLTNELLIDWKLFFSNEDEDEDGGAPVSQRTLLIDTLISIEMTKIPKVPPEPEFSEHIVRANLEAGFFVSLPSGVEMAKQVKKLNEESSELIDILEDTDEATFKSMNIVDVPLWPYLLLEAQKQKLGNRLGSLGSLLNAQVLRQSISMAEYSIFQLDIVDNSNKDFFTYDFDKVLFQLGLFGQLLKERNYAKAKKLSMFSIASIINEK